MIGERRIDGYRALTLSDAEGTLEAALVPGAGMVCCSLLHHGEQILGQRNGLRAYVERRSTMGIPLLYPWANRLGRDRFAVAGTEIDLGGDRLVKRDANGLPMHGLLSAYPDWTVTTHEVTASGAALGAELEWERDSELLRRYPFPHRLALRAEIAPGRLELSTTVSAHEDRPLPVAFGFHPYLRLPGVPRRHWRLELPVRQRLILDDRGLPSGEQPEVEPLNGELASRSFDDLYAAPAAGKPVTLSGGGRRIELAMDAAYPYVQIYAPAADELIAIEPMTAPTDALSRGTAPLLEPGADLTARFSIAVRRCGT